MHILPAFLLRIVKAGSQPDREDAKMSIIIQQPYAYLEEELRKVFDEQGDVQIIVDRRHGERRASRQPSAEERRRADRRRLKEVLVEVAM